MTIKAILFDMDGVLIDAREWHYEALNKALNHFGFFISLESHLSTFDGLPTRNKLEILSKSIGLPNSLIDLINDLKQKYTIQKSNLFCKPKFNHIYALSRLTKKYKIAVCSNSTKNTIQTLMSLSKLEPYLDFVISNEDVKYPKPDKEMYVKAMVKLNLKPYECLIVEDNENGIKSAKASGGNLLEVKDPNEVTYNLITSKIKEIEGDYI